MYAMKVDYAKLPAAIWAIITAVAMLLTGILDYGTPASSKAVELVREDKIVLEEAMFAGQGITTDGTYYYTSGAMTAVNMNGLAKWQIDGDDFKMVAYNLQAIPEKYNKEYGSNHIGGISYYNGLLYCAVENDADDYPLIITYDCNSLQPVTVYTLPLEHLPNGVPWCAVDAENGLLYCSPFRDVTEIPAFHLADMSYSHSIVLDKSVTRIQGGEVFEGTLYLSYDVSGSNEEQILAVDVLSGKVDTVCHRVLPSVAGNEAEGITVFPMEDGSFFHVIDYDKSVGTYIRHYTYDGTVMAY